MDAQYLDVVQLKARQLPPLPPLLPNPLDPTRSISIGIPIPTIIRTTTSITTRSTSTTSSTSTTTSVTTSPTSTASTTDPITQTTVIPQTNTHTVTAPGDAATTNAASPPQSTPTGFLQNKVLSGVVFGIVGLVVLVLLIILGTCVVRRRRNKRLMREAINFDPVVAGTTYAEALEASKSDAEKGRTSDSSSGHGHGPSWTPTPLPGQPNAYAFGPPPGPTQGQPYVPPTSWSTTTANPNARYLPPSQLYRNPEAQFPATNAPGY